MNNIAVRRHAMAWLTVIVALILSACGGGGSSSFGGTTIAGDSMRVSLSSTGVEKAEGPNLIDLSDRWSGWDGTVADVTYDPATDRLRIGTPGSGRDMVIGVRRFDQALVAGTRYTLAVTASNPQAAALLFLFDAGGGIVPVDGAPYVLARDGAPFDFVAPAGVSGFYLQVQNQWRATAPATLDARLNPQLDDGSSGGGASAGPNLVRLSGPWPDWSGRATAVRLDATGRFLVLPPPAAGSSTTIAVRGFADALTAGATYELAADAGSDPQTAVLLFLFDASGRTITFVGGPAEPARPWIAASPGQPLQFIAPAGVVRFAIQVQGPWLGTTTTKIAPALRQVGSPSCAPVAQPPVLRVAAEGPGFPLGAVAVSDDAAYIAFASTFDVDGSAPAAPRPSAVFLLERATGRITRVTPPGADGSSYNVSLSFDGRYLLFQSEASGLIAGQPDANGNVMDVFVYERADSVIRRISPGTSPLPTRVPGFGSFVGSRNMPTDGHLILMSGLAPGLTPDEVANCARGDCEQLLLVDRPAGTVTPLAARFGTATEGSSAAISGNGRFVAASTLSFSGRSELRHLDLETGQVRRFTPGVALGAALSRPSLSFDGSVIVSDGPAVNLLPGETAPSVNRYNLFVADLNADTFTRLSATTQANEWNLGSTVSLDGKVIAIRTAYGDNPIGASQVWVHHRPSGARTPATPSLQSGASFSYPALSADGRLLVTRGSLGDGTVGIFETRVEHPCP